jgi:hypothetical protein
MGSSVMPGGSSSCTAVIAAFRPSTTVIVAFHLVPLHLQQYKVRWLRSAHLFGGVADPRHLVQPHGLPPRRATMMALKFRFYW